MDYAGETLFIVDIDNLIYVIISRLTLRFNISRS